MRRLRRLMAVVMGLVATMALAGCDVTGTITIRADDMVELDLRAVIDSDQSCEWQLGPGVRTDERRMRNSAQRLCLLQGTVNKEELRRWSINVAHAGEHIEVVANPLGVVGPNEQATSSLDVDDLAIEVTFPGEVLESTGIEEGNTVRFTDVSQLGKAQGLRVVALDHAGPRLGIVVPVVAFGLGVFAVAVLWASVNRQTLQDRFTAMPSATLGRRPGAPEEPTRGGSTGSVVGPGSMLPDDLRQGAAHPGGPDPLTGASGWERPGARPAGWEDPGEENATPAPEHEKWAPRDGPD